jgi:hypothetical protein
MTNGNPTAIRIIRAGNGQVRAVPSPAPLARKQEFVVKNWTDCPANADFTGVPVDPTTSRIDPGGEARFDVKDDAAYGYYEYDVTLACSDKNGKPVEQYVEGGSRPGLIIDR